MMAEVVVLGGCIIDLISYAPRFPKPGETMAGTEFHKGFGGKGANQCVMADRLGASTALIAKIGSDSFGKEYFQSVKESNILEEFLTFDEVSQTSTAAICVTDEGQNSIIYVPGAISKLNRDDVRKAEETIANSKVLLCTYEAPLEPLLEALTIAKKNKVMTIVNAAPAANSSYECLYPLIDIICLNEVEAEDATGVSIDCLQDANLAIKSLVKKKCSTVIITLGAKGAIFQAKNKDDVVHIPAQNIKPLDSTGAGDAFMGSLAYFIAKHPGLSLREMIDRSCGISTLSVLKKGTQTSFPYREEAKQYLQPADSDDKYILFSDIINM